MLFIFPAQSVSWRLIDARWPITKNPLITNAWHQLMKMKRQKTLTNERAHNLQSNCNYSGCESIDWVLSTDEGKITRRNVETKSKRSNHKADSQIWPHQRIKSFRMCLVRSWMWFEMDWIEFGLWMLLNCFTCWFGFVMPPVVRHCLMWSFYASLNVHCSSWTQSRPYVVSSN